MSTLKSRNSGGALLTNGTNPVKKFQAGAHVHQAGHRHDVPYRQPYRTYPVEGHRHFIEFHQPGGMTSLGPIEGAEGSGHMSGSLDSWSVREGIHGPHGGRPKDLRGQQPGYGQGGSVDINTESNIQTNISNPKNSTQSGLLKSGNSHGQLMQTGKVAKPTSKPRSMDKGGIIKAAPTAKQVAKPTPKMNRGGVAKPVPRPSCCRGGGGRVAPKPAPRPAPKSLSGGSRGGGLVTRR